ncbi:MULTISPECIES: universal stress protein [Natrialbaceae]|uniref:universal stress protein n=1 Tax=Natrialbaceae TaxID=1644061 RepID=UPI00207D60D5|nr:universal stress protein [Natronococcus sp. CG52]
MSRHVLVAIDDSEASRSAFEYALEEYPESRITALHVFDPTHPNIYADATGGSAEQYEEFELANREHGAELLEEATELAADRGREVRTALEDGTPAETIVDYAADHDIDRLVVGTRDRAVTSRALLGSVSRAVAKRASVPVTIV